jgi:AcrR family transcriptional regulator
MEITARILRAQVNKIAPPPPLTPRQQARETRILAGAEHILARYGTENITYRLLAVALTLTTATLRWHFVDLHALLAEILRRHLKTIAEALQASPANQPEARAAAYRAATHHQDGTPKDAHILLLRDRHLLPPDELEDIEAAYQTTPACPTPASATKRPVPQPPAQPPAKTQAPTKPASAIFGRPPPFRMNTPLPKQGVISADLALAILSAAPLRPQNPLP